MNAITAATILLPQWIATASAFWLIWWAAKSRDPGFPLVALILAIAPAVLLPFVSVFVQTGQLPVSSISAIFTITTFAVSAIRGLYLGVWAAVSKDEAYLRIGGAAIAALLTLWMLFGVAALLLTGGELFR